MFATLGRRLAPIFLVAAATLAGAAEPIHVLVWDEQQPEQKQAYTNFLGNQIATCLRAFTNLSVKSVSITDPDRGLSPELYDTADVLIWWGHKRHTEVPNAEARRIVARVKEGKLALIALHSAHWSEPFVEAMRERTLQDIPSKFPIPTRVKPVAPPRFEVPGPGAMLTPNAETVWEEGHRVLRVNLPRCVFPAYRADGAPSHVLLQLPNHPIARGLPKRFDIPHTEMYSEPFHVPKPDAVIFEERWDKGERFRSACLWNLGKGKVFYFRPGHETYPVYLQAEPLRIVSNAVLWMGEQVRQGK